MIFIYATVFVGIQLIEQNAFDGVRQKQISAFLRSFLEILHQTSAITANQSVSGFENDQDQSPLH